MQSEGSPTPRGRDSATKDSGGKGGSRAETKNQNKLKREKNGSNTRKTKLNKISKEHRQIL